MTNKWDLNTYCEILGVSENSPQHEIHAAYLSAKQLYSKKNLKSNFTNEEAETLEQLVEEAFAILGNHSLRAFYQRKNKNQLVDKKTPKSTVTLTQPEPQQKAISDYEVNPDFEYKINKLQSYDGSNLQKIRQYKNISLHQLSTATKIKSTYIKAIEDNNFNSLPAPVYTRGFIIQIAKVLGLKHEEVASSYMSQYKNKYEPRV